MREGAMRCSKAQSGAQQLRQQQHGSESGDRMLGKVTGDVIGGVSGDVSGDGAYRVELAEVRRRDGAGVAHLAPHTHTHTHTHTYTNRSITEQGRGCLTPMRGARRPASRAREEASRAFHRPPSNSPRSNSEWPLGKGAPLFPRPSPLTRRHRLGRLGRLWPPPAALPAARDPRRQPRPSHLRPSPSFLREAPLPRSRRGPIATRAPWACEATRVCVCVCV